MIIRISIPARAIDIGQKEYDIVKINVKDIPRRDVPMPDILTIGDLFIYEPTNSDIPSIITKIGHSVASFDHEVKFR